MCGIAGLVDFRGDQDILKRVTEMVSVISHRGPDGEGVVCHENVAIGHRRLAIIDLTDDAAQPMTNWSGDLVLSFNGEIYNYVELRAELTARGRQFRSQSDTEVLLQAYEEWGEECVTKLNGMWSFAIFDKCRNRFFCSRDRFGEKPFYFTQQSDGFYFGSEIRQLLKVCEARTANRNLLNRFLLGVVGEDIGDTFF
jgi:asparagine synthase (glutamine-hydrolysing)